MFLLVAIVVGLTIFHICTRYNRVARFSRKIAGPRAYPIVGNLFTYDLSNQETIWASIRCLSKTYYPITRIWAIKSVMYFVRHPDDVEIILMSNKTINKGWIYEYFECWLKTGLLTSSGAKWKQRRKILTPAFHFAIVKKYMEVVQEQTENLIKKLREDGNEEMVENLTSFCSKYTLNVVAETAMGVALNKMDSKTIDEFTGAVHGIGDYFIRRIVKPYITDWSLKVMPFLDISRKRNKCLGILHRFTDKMIQERRNYHERTGYEYLQQFTDNPDESVDGRYMVKRRRLAMLDLLLAAERDGLIDDEGIREEVDTFTFEGHDTTATAMAFLLKLLSENKGAQDLARAEVLDVMKKNGGKIEISDLSELNYLDRCVKEGLRLYPSVSHINRRLVEDVKLKNAFLPKGADVALSFYDLHRDPNFWEDPEKFDPDRFLPENVRKRHPFAYVPFSAGPRNCIGQKFAMSVMKFFVASILGNFYLEPVGKLSEIKLSVDLVIRTSKPIYVKFVKINDQSSC
ncbi:hypothetical protein QAD02_010840 [Eretmocerus hayati]|uniref:Uncharacterized protein n=1 Tax=Eretmocerus hayati TaxID=131215 RepID=A0ACC2NUX2_9HYME|nr:hypothetical protein QAD02_010840 [Eretmocerus hayati]